ncbi:MAG: hypothetical protein IJ092_10945 [Atopobiaceae bacterium]|nr:hypothetical protein [Atopobiaceae bacterium]MBR1827999.1 hypothetical protein [Atopobiaceae bacterium]
MADVRDLDGYDIPEELLDSVAGGVIIKDGYFYYVARDTNGNLIDSEPNLSQMQAVAQQRGLSLEVITPEEYKKRFGRDF